MENELLNPLTITFQRGVAEPIRFELMLRDADLKLSYQDFSERYLVPIAAQFLAKVKA
jgi:hypothetical protein